jgi:hypothetical protein
MRKVSIIFSLLCAWAVLASAQQLVEAAKPTPSADDVARRSFDILGGTTAWEKARYLAFTLTVEREGKVATSYPQRLDRFSGDYRVSGKNQDGTPFEVIMNLKTLKGRATRNGSPVTDPAVLKDLLDVGYRRFINDTFWLLMPLKMFDPGVHRTYEGERTDSCGHTWDLVKLTFDQATGLTPGDVYWPWINRDTGVVEEWDMKLQSMKPEEPPLQVMFHDYRRIAGLLISMRREVRGRNQIVRLDDLQILPGVPKGAFE